MADDLLDGLIGLALIAGAVFGIKWAIDNGYLEKFKDLKFPMIGGGGSSPFKTTGRRCGCVDGSQKISCSGGSAMSKRMDCKCGFTRYVAKGTIQFGGGCTSSCGDEATIKCGGPNHDDGKCCWAIGVVRQNGQCSFGGEGPHPNTDLGQGSLGSVGNLQGKRVGIMVVFAANAGGGAHQELWVDAGGGWKKMGERNLSSWGASKKSNKIASGQSVEFRCDCSRSSWSNCSVEELA